MSDAQRPVLDYEPLPARRLLRRSAVALVSGTIVVAGSLYLVCGCAVRTGGDPMPCGAGWTTGPTTAPVVAPAPTGKGG